MQDQTLLATYLKKQNWNAANEWMQKECRLLHGKALRQRIAVHAFGVPASVVMAFFTWVVLYPSADPKELEAFPLATLCNDLFQTLSSSVPGGAITVVAASILLPFVVCGLMMAVFCGLKSNKYTELRTGGVKVVSDNLDQLTNVYWQYADASMALMWYTLLAGALTGGVMVFSSAIGGLNPFEYLFVGLICAAVYFGILFVCAWLWSRLVSRFGVKFSPTYELRDILRPHLESGSSDSYSSSYSGNSGVESTDYYREKVDEYYARYMGIPYETPEERAKRIAAEIDDDLTGNYGDY